MWFFRINHPFPHSQNLFFGPILVRNKVWNCPLDRHGDPFSSIFCSITDGIDSHCLNRIRRIQIGTHFPDETQDRSRLSYNMLVPAVILDFKNRKLPIRQCRLQRLEVGKFDRLVGKRNLAIKIYQGVTVYEEMVSEMESNLHSRFRSMFFTYSSDCKRKSDRFCSTSNSKVGQSVLRHFHHFQNPKLCAESWTCFGFAHNDDLFSMRGLDRILLSEDFTTTVDGYIRFYDRSTYR